MFHPRAYPYPFETEEAVIELWTGHAEQQLKSPLSHMYQAST